MNWPICWMFGFLLLKTQYQNWENDSDEMEIPQVRYSTILVNDVKLINSDTSRLHSWLSNPP